MIALLAAGLVQTGIAFHAMNGMVRSNHQITPTPYVEEASAPVLTPGPLAAPSVKESFALADPGRPNRS